MSTLLFMIAVNAASGGLLFELLTDEHGVLLLVDSLDLLRAKAHVAALKQVCPSWKTTAARLSVLSVECDIDRDAVDFIARALEWVDCRVDAFTARHGSPPEVVVIDKISILHPLGLSATADDLAAIMRKLRLEFPAVAFIVGVSTVSFADDEDNLQKLMEYADNVALITVGQLTLAKAKADTPRHLNRFNIVPVAGLSEGETFPLIRAYSPLRQMGTPQLSRLALEADADPSFEAELQRRRAERVGGLH